MEKFTEAEVIEVKEVDFYFTVLQHNGGGQPFMPHMDGKTTASEAVAWVHDNWNEKGHYNVTVVRVPMLVPQNETDK